MKKSKLAGTHDYLAALVRRKWWVIITFISVTALCLLLATMLPKIYISETMMQIQPREVPTDFVKDLIAGNTEQRLTAIEQTILSRTNLLKILSQFESDMATYRGLNDERKVLKLRKQIQIEFPSERVRGQYLPITNVRIAYRDQNPALAQKVTARLASLFIEQESMARESQVFGTTEFLTTEMNKIAQQLQQSELNLKVLKERYRYELPTELETNLRTLDRLQLQKNGNLEALDRYITMQLNLERQISETPAMIQREAAARMEAASALARNPQVETYRKKEREYNDLIARNTEKHPDVQRLKAELDQLKKDIPPEDFVDAEPSAAVPAPEVFVPNPAYQNLQGQLRQIKTEIEIREREKKYIESEMGKYTQRVQNTPRAEQEIAAVLRTNSDLTKQYDDIKKNLGQAKLSESLESRQKGSQFVTVDPANYPLESATPSRISFTFMGMLISFGLGLVVAFIAEMLDRRIWTHPELERFLEAPVLIEIPTLVSAQDVAKERKRQILRAAAFVAGISVYLGGLYYIYLRQPAALRVLDPVIEKMMERMMSQ